MIRINRRNDEPNEKFLRRFKRACEKSDITSEQRKREYYESPGQQRHRQIRKKLKQLEKEKQEKLMNGFRRPRS